MAYPAPTLLAFVGLAAVASASDVATRRIPNWLSVPLLAGGLAAQAALGARSVLSALAAAVVTALLLVPLWAAKRVGGGDLKLAVAAAAWVGLGALDRYLLASAVAGGALAVVSYAASRADTRITIRANLLAAGRGGAIGPPLVAEGRVPVAAGAAFALGAIWILAGG